MANRYFLITVVPQTLLGPTLPGTARITFPNESKTNFLFLTEKDVQTWADILAARIKKKDFLWCTHIENLILMSEGITCGGAVNQVFHGILGSYSYKVVPRKILPSGLWEYRVDFVPVEYPQEGGRRTEMRVLVDTLLLIVRFRYEIAEDFSKRLDIRLTPKELRPAVVQKCRNDLINAIRKIYRAANAQDNQVDEFSVIEAFDSKEDRHQVEMLQHEWAEAFTQLLRDQTENADEISRILKSMIKINRSFAVLTLRRISAVVSEDWTI